MKRRTYLFLLVGVLVLGSLAYGGEARRVVKIGAVAYAPRTVTIWEGMTAYFWEQGIPADYVLYSNYDALVDAFVNREIDVAWNTALAYVESQRRLNGACLILAMRDVDVSFTSKFITRGDTGIRSLQDLRGRTFAIGSRDSAQAAILPLFFLRQHGIDPEKDLKLVRFDMDLGKHGDTGSSERAVVKAVLTGQADAGAVGQDLWESALAKGEVNPSQVMAFWTTPPFSHCNFTIRPDFDPEMARKMAQAFLSMDYKNPKHRVIMELEGLKAWVLGQKEGYKPLEDALGVHSE